MRLSFAATPAGLSVGRALAGRDGIAVAHAAGQVALAVDRAVRVEQTGQVAGAAGPGQVDLPWIAGRIELSPSGQYLVAISHDSKLGLVFDLRDGKVALSIGDGENLPRSLVFAFMLLADGREAAVFSKRPSDLDMVALPGCQPVLRCDAWKFPYVLARPVPLLDGDTLALVGWIRGDYDTLFLVSVRGLAADPEGTSPFLAAPGFGHPVYDSTERIAVGPAGRDAMVQHRTPLESEFPDEDGEVERPRDSNAMHGFHIRRLDDRAIVEVVPCDLHIPTAAPLFATEEAIVAAVEGAVLLVGRRGAGAGQVLDRVDAIAAALDPAAGRAAIVRLDGSVAVLGINTVEG